MKFESTKLKSGGGVNCGGGARFADWLMVGPWDIVCRVKYFQSFYRK